MPLFVLLALAAATAPADKPRSGPPPEWVHPFAGPADAKLDDAAVAILLNDQQVRLTAGGTTTYIETRLRAQTPQGLAALGTISIPWKPDTSTLTVHKLVILRGDKTIDVLDGRNFEVLRRENNLEYAALDGILTAVIQPVGLEVGDIVDLAATIDSRDPVLHGNSEAIVAGGFDSPVAHLRLRAVWDDALKVTWRQAEGLPPATRKRGSGSTELAIAADAMQPLVTPKGAPQRFGYVRFVEASSFARWSDIAQLFAPLYAIAETLKPGSPLAAEIARIAAASADPGQRAEAALALVEDRVRYVFLGLADGGLVPATADLSWDRRFADCKGKTVLLLALLHGLGIAAEPALVSIGGGDGLDTRLPRVGAFDHVIVRAMVGGKVYWLDATRTGDRKLSDLNVPPFVWALPVRASGSALERLVVTSLDRPSTEIAIRIDATAGIHEPAPFHVEATLRGDGATALRLQLANLTADTRDRVLREYWKKQYDFVTAKSVIATTDPTTGEQHLAMDGSAAMDWQYGYEADGMGVGYTVDFSRPAGLHADAPWATFSTGYEQRSETILLPGDGKAFISDIPDIDRTVAGVEYRRIARLVGNSWTVTASTRGVALEMPANEAPAAEAALRAMSKARVILKYANYHRTRAETATLLAKLPVTAFDFSERGRLNFDRRDFNSAITDATRAIELDGTNAGYHAQRGWAYLNADNVAAASTDFDAALTISPHDADARLGRATILSGRGAFEQALADLDDSLATRPDHFATRAIRASTHYRLGHYALALADIDLAVQAEPNRIDTYLLRANIYRAMGEREKAIAQAAAVVAANPGFDYAEIVAASIEGSFGRDAQAIAHLDHAIAIKPTVSAYLERAERHPRGDLAARRADIAAAGKLKPGSDDVRFAEITLAAETRDFAALVALADTGIRKTPTDATLLNYRGIGYAGSGRTAAAATDFAAARASAKADPSRLNALCWNKATMNVALDAALADCDAALALAPDRAGILDSRGFVLLRLGRFKDAIVAYDRALARDRKLAVSLYGRGLAKRGAGQVADGDADLAAAKAIAPTIAEIFDRYGVKQT